MSGITSSVSHKAVREDRADKLENSLAIALQYE